jgi:hypothetical protein
MSILWLISKRNCTPAQQAVIGLGVCCGFLLLLFPFVRIQEESDRMH